MEVAIRVRALILIRIYYFQLSCKLRFQCFQSLKTILSHAYNIQTKVKSRIILYAHIFLVILIGMILSVSDICGISQTE